MGTTCGHTTLTPKYTRITTRDAHTTGITDIEFTTGTIAIITIAIELSGWRSLSKRFFTEVRSRKDKPGVDLISDALPFGAAVVCRTKCRCECYRLCAVLQPITS